ncbi:MAG: alanine racemase [Lachnospiraceae bacterium]|nr:alanine racemase [Lachnospiraceae bacterium]
MKNYLRVCAEINLDAVAYNFRSMKENLVPGTQIIAVTKTDGYGHGAVPIAKMIEGYDYVWGFATATIEEALLLRKEGIQKPILILSFVFPDVYEEVVAYDLRPTVFKLSMARQLSEEAVRQGKTVHMHIKVDTGMSRIGFLDHAENADVIKEISQLPNVDIEGLYTHFAKADERDKSSVKEQFERYQEFSRLLNERGVDIKLHHCGNSAAIFDLREMNLDAVRAGIAIYGLYPSEEVNKFAVPITPVMSLKSHVVFIKEIEAGTAVSYGGTFVADHTMKVATIPVGYGDGYPRALSNKGWVLIRGHQAPIIGRICMDQFMVDVTHIADVQEGDFVTLIGSQGGREITMEDMGELSGRFNYELACDIGKRVPRRYWKDGKVVACQDYFETTGIIEE